MAKAIKSSLLMNFNSGAATTASRLGQPDVAIATLNDFVGVRYFALDRGSIGLIILFRPRRWFAACNPPFRSLRTPIQGKLSPSPRFFVTNKPCSFGGPANVARTVRQYVRAGVAGMHIEDQVQTKRCGHLLGKQVVSREEFLTRIRAAVIARDSIPGGSDFVGTV